VLIYGQVNYSKEYYKADSLIQTGEVENGYQILKLLETQVNKSNKLYNDILGYQIDVVSFLERESRMNEDFETSLKYGLEALNLIEKGKKIFKKIDKKFADREPFMIKNVSVSYFGLKKYEEAKKYKDWLYNAHKQKKLPEGIDEYFNFDYFKWEDKNIWGYEWFAELPKNRFSGSFSKVVYYVYSTNPDGSDNEQLYRLHVLMFHGTSVPFDYVMTKRLETATNEVSGTLYSYTYKEDIDFEKLHNDVIEILKGNLQPDTKTTIPKQADEEGKIKVDVEMNVTE
jgi:hypothetical protein